MSNARDGSRPTMSRRRVVLLMAAGLVGGTVACSGRMVLTEQAEARRLATALHLEFVRSSDAANRAVFSVSDEASAAAAKEARDAAATAQSYLDQLEPIVRSLAYDDELRALDGFKNRFEEYRTLDEEVLSLAVENTNLKAQRLSFGAGREAVDALSAALTTATAGASGTIVSQALTVRTAVLEVQVLQARHIAESEDATMTAMETQMAALLASAKKALAGVRAGSRASGLDAAATALDRFAAVNDEIVTLSRRNSNVRSTAVTFGRKRVVTAECEDQLRLLESSLAGHSLKATK